MDASQDHAPRLHMARNARHPWTKLTEVGASIFIPGTTAAKLASSRSNAEKRLNIKIICRTVIETDPETGKPVTGVRAYRIE